MKRIWLYFTMALVLACGLVACGTQDTVDEIEGVYWLFVDEHADEYDDFTTGYYFDGSGNYKYATPGYSFEAQYKIEKVDTTADGVVYTINVYQDGDLWGEHILTLKNGILTENIEFGAGSGAVFTFKAVDEETFTTTFQ